MGNFLALVASEPFPEEAERLFQTGLRAARSLKQQIPSQTLVTPRARAASFPRRNGSGSPITQDAKTGSWLAASGVWFHSSGYACGEEPKLLQRFLQAGAEQVARELEGFFTIVIGDAARRETVVITDIVGSCHAFVRLFPGTVALSGSSLLLAALNGSTLDATACQEFIHTGIIYQDRTLFKEVRKLAPASIFRFAHGALKSEQRYWDAASLAPESLQGEAAVQRLWGTLTEATRKIARVFAHPVCDLTGGYDSRALAAAFLSVRPGFGTTVSGPAESADVIVSKGLAQLTNLPHRHFAPREDLTFTEVRSALAFTDGEYDLVDYARILSTHSSLSRDFDISLNGSFGELARGYWWELLVPRTGWRRPLDAAKLARLRYLPRAWSGALFACEIRLELVPHFTRVVEQTNGALVSRPNTFQMDHAYVGMRMQRWQGRIASSTNQLWPCLSPFMFTSVLETMLQASSKLRKRSLLVRRMLAEFQPRLAEFPLEYGYPAAPTTWRNFYCFRSLLSYYGERVLERAGGKTGSHNSTPLRLKLWEEDEVRELLKPASMKVANLADQRGLAAFLDGSRRSEFTADPEWRRLLTLEYTVRELDRVRGQLTRAAS